MVIIEPVVSNNSNNDDFLIDLAMECQADFIITYNQKDLQAAEKFGIRVLTPKEFLQQVGEIS
jgi:predicted nucleic acid-binding protein